MAKNEDNHAIDVFSLFVQEDRRNKIKNQVRCIICDRLKKPWGRDAPAALLGSICSHECEGYRLDPMPGILWDSEIGYSEEERCGRNECVGVIKLYRSESCYCHINPPCKECIDSILHCPTCGWEEEEE